jgi:hypothetical protein
MIAGVRETGPKRSSLAASHLVLMTAPLAGSGAKTHPVSTGAQDSTWPDQCPMLVRSSKTCPAAKLIPTFRPLLEGPTETRLVMRI